jgi:dimethylargininase
VAAVKEALQPFFPQTEIITLPGILDGGDVMQVENRFYIGLSERTNRQGAQQLADFLIAYGMESTLVELDDVLHLKTAVNYLQDHTFLVAEGFAAAENFRNFRVISVPQDEAYAANSLWLNGTVLVPQGHPKTRGMIADAGYNMMEIDVSEFQKADGGLSCLSLRF